MNVPNYLKIKRAKGKIFFTLHEISSELSISSGAARSALHRLKLQGDIISPARGLYIIVAPEDQPFGSIPAEELIPLLMKHLQADYYVALLSAAQYYGATHQKPARFQVISNKRLRHPLTFGRVSIELIYKKSLTDLPTQNRTVKTGYLTISSPELTVFDLLTYPAKSGGLNHIATVLSELAETLDAKKLTAIAEKTNTKGWLQRLGYLLEQIEISDEPKTKKIIDVIERYLQKKPKTILSLAPELPTDQYPKNKKWMIVENCTIESDL